MDTVTIPRKEYEQLKRDQELLEQREVDAYYDAVERCVREKKLIRLR